MEQTVDDPHGMQDEAQPNLFSRRLPEFERDGRLLIKMAQDELRQLAVHYDRMGVHPRSAHMMEQLARGLTSRQAAAIILLLTPLLRYPR